MPTIITQSARIESGPGGPAETPAKRARIILSAAEAHDLLEALQYWKRGVDAGAPDDGWHARVIDSLGNDLTIEISPHRPKPQP